MKKLFTAVSVQTATLMEDNDLRGGLAAFIDHRAVPLL